MYKKLYKPLLLLFIFLIPFLMTVQSRNVFAGDTKGDSKVKIYLFWSSTCPNCSAEIEFLNEMKKKYPEMEIRNFEVSKNRENNQFMYTVKDKFKNPNSGVPFTIIGEKSFVGFSEAIKVTLENSIIEYSKKPTSDYVEKLLNNVDNFEIDPRKSQVEPVIDIPLIGVVNLKNFSLPSIAIILGMLDGFNPCAMWVLLLLISVLLDIKNSKRRWILGLTFLVTSSLIYLGFMMTWITISMTFSRSIILRNIIALILVEFGVWSIYSNFKKKNQISGCNVTDGKKKKKLFDKMQNVAKKKSIILSVLAIIMLAVSVNFIELICSAGIPLLFAEMLVINEISGFSILMYNLLYVLFFILDDILIFSIAMFTLRATSFSTKYSKYSNIIGGVIMLIIGVLLVFKMDWLTFSF